MSKYKIAFVVVMILYITTAWLSLNTLFVYTPDSARYVAWANSLSHFNGFTDTTEPEPVRYCIHSPLYALTLSPVAFFFPRNIVALKVVNIIFAVGISIFLYVILAKKANELAALIIASIFLLHPWTYFLSTQLLTEILFGLGLIALLYFLANEREENPRPIQFYAVLASLLVCIFSREVGILLMPVVVGFYFIRKNYNKAIITFFIPFILYITWYIRNEIYYAGIELPVLRNSTLFFSNVLASMEASFFVELRFRIMNNFNYYIRELMALLFYTSYNVYAESLFPPWISMIDVFNPVFFSVANIVRSVFWILGIVSIGLVVGGAVLEFRRDRNIYLKIIFFCIYLAVILIYPVFDVRFLFPLLLLFLLWAGYTLYYIVKLNIRFLPSIVVILIVILCIPNVVWSWNFVTTQYKMKKNSEEFYQQENTFEAHPNNSHQTFRSVVEWFNEQNDTSSVIIAPYKELSFFLNNKLVRVVNGFTPLTTFNQIIRDYEVRYIFMLKDVTGWRDYEYQIGMNDQYSFQLVYAANSVEVYEIMPKTKEEQKQRLEGVIQKMKSGNYLSVDSFFVRNQRTVAGNSKLVLLDMINKHFMDQLDSAQILMRKLYSMPQGLLYARQASLHQTTIDRRKQLEKETSPALRADLLMTLGLNYWELGMVKNALKFSHECLDIDSSYVLAYAYNIIFDLAAGDTAHAFSVYYKLQRNFPATDFTYAIDSLMQTYQHYRTTSSVKQKALLLEKLATTYASLRLDDIAIDCARLALKDDPQRISLFTLLADVYERQHRYYPALEMTNRYLAVQQDPEIEQQKHRLKAKLYLE